MRFLVAALAALLLWAAPAAAATCTGSPSSVARFGDGGFVAYPRSAPRAVVVVAHGYSFTAAAWRSKLTRIARDERAVAVAVDYEGRRLLPRDGAGRQRERGWPLVRGAADVVSAARSLRRRCRSARRSVLLGFSMGANVASVAVARNPGAFDAFLGVEGIYDLEGTWRAGAPFREGNAFLRRALEDVERETGGTPDTAPAAYDARNPIELARRVARGVRRITMVHARDDGLALFAFAEEMRKRLRAAGRPPRFVAIDAAGPDDEPDTSLAETLGQPRAGAGHAPDWAVRHVTVRTALRELSRLLR